ncbi:MAG: hypothetical protein OEN56_14175 [Gemmatimonadota bacterium]|nr:hypothetical protein [Gemmatimonadota bacterium]
MPKNGSRRGATDMGTPLMILAFVVIAGFLYWLSGQAAIEREARTIVEEVPEEDLSGAQVVAPTEIQMDATPFEGQEIRLNTINVASLLGDQGFWLEMPNGNPFLVSKGAEVMASGITISPGRPATVIGTVHAMSDSTLTAWTEAGTIAEGDRIVAEFATHYIEATDVRTSGGGGSGAAGN